MEVVLGDIKIDIPPERKIDFTGMRTMVKYDVPGDRPRYQDMGRDERTVRWNGIFYGDGAYDQALALQTFYDGGKNVDTGTEKSGFLFLFEDISCRVLIKSYSYQYYRKDKVRYDIELVRLESDFDKKEAQQKTSVDKVTKAKSGLDKLKDQINQAMKGVNNIIKTAQKIQQTLYSARKAYLDVMKCFSPISQLKYQVDQVKLSFDRTLLTITNSIGQTTSSRTNQQTLVAAYTELQTTIPVAQTLVDAAQRSTLNQRFAELVQQMKTRPVLQGDTLRSIAAEVYGSPHQWIVIAKANGLTSSIIPDSVKEIRVPDNSNIAAFQNLLLEQAAQLPQAVCDYLPRNVR